MKRLLASLFLVCAPAALGGGPMWAQMKGLVK